MRILVAGALGEVGRTVTAELASLGGEITPVSARAGEAGVDALPLAVAVGKISGGQVDLVVNMAGRGDRRTSSRTGLVATQALAASAEGAGIPAILVSTTRVLEDLAGDFAEDAAPACHTPYAEANAQNEELWRAAAPRMGSVLRITNYFCPPMASDSPQSLLLPWSLVTEAADRGAVEVRSAPDTSREFVSARDVATALLAVAASAPSSRVCATAPGLVLTLANLAACVQAGFVLAGRPEPRVTFGTAVSTASACRPGWLADHGWSSSLTAEQVTRVVAEWLPILHLD